MNKIKDMKISNKAVWLFTIVAIIGSVISGYNSDYFRNFLL